MTDTPEHLTIQTVEAQHQQWLQVLATSDTVQVDLSALERLDTAGLQLLLYWCQHRPLRITGLNNVLIAQVIARFDLGSTFEQVME